MQVKTLIKLLQEADPTGELHVMGKDAILGIEIGSKGYDGAVCHYVENTKHYPNKYYISEFDTFLYLQETELEDFIWGEDGSTENIILDLPKDKEEHYRNIIDTTAQESKIYHKQSQDSFVVVLLKYFQEGNKIYNDDNPDIENNKIVKWHSQYRIKANEDTQTRLCQGECGALINSGIFKIDFKTREWSVR